MSLEEDGDNFIGKAKVLDTPNGKIVKNLIEEGVSFGLSSRGLGKVYKKGGVDIVEKYYMVTPADIVSDPSGPDCWATAIMENKEWAFLDGRIVDKEYIIKERINRSASVEGALLEIFNEVLNKYK